jgi:probable phosphoglycerate mutase
MKLYFVRHGKTEWNLEGRLQGMNGDSPLLPESYAQIAKLGMALKDVKFDAAFSSTSPRAVNTAQGIIDENAHPLKLQQDLRIREWKLGEFEGRIFMELHEQYPEIMHNFRNRIDLFPGHDFGGEELDDVIGRFTHFLKDVSENDYENVLIVSHGAVLTSFLRYLTGTPREELRKGGGLENNTLTLIDETNGVYTLETWNKHYD